MKEERPTPGRHDSDGSRQAFGRRAERDTARHLIGLGWRILARNWRIGAGELDLVCLDHRTIVFVEVKALRAGGGKGPVRPVLAVGPDKRDRLARLGSAWIAGPGQSSALADLWDDVRFDVVGIEHGPAGGKPALEHVEDAFRPEELRSRRRPAPRRYWR